MSQNVAIYMVIEHCVIHQHIVLGKYSYQKTQDKKHKQLFHVIFQSLFYAVHIILPTTLISSLSVLVFYLPADSQVWYFPWIKNNLKVWIQAAGCIMYVYICIYICNVLTTGKDYFGHITWFVTSGLFDIDHREVSANNKHSSSITGQILGFHISSEFGLHSCDDLHFACQSSSHKLPHAPYIEMDFPGYLTMDVIYESIKGI